MKITRRKVSCLCSTCFGLRYIYRSAERVQCPECKGEGNVDKWLNEVHSEAVQP